MTGSLQTKTTSSGSEYFYINLRYKDPETAKWKSKTISTGLPVKNNKRKAAGMINELISQYAYLENPLSVRIPKLQADISLCEFMDIWLKNKKTEVRKSTYEGYSYRVKRIKEFFLHDDPKVVDVTPYIIDTFFRYALEYGKINQKSGEREPLCVRSVRSYKSILNAVFEDAIIYGLIVTNPVSTVKVHGKKNKKLAKEYVFLTEDETERLMNFLSEHYPDLLEIAFFGCYYGLRRSEILGLKWDAIDFKRNVIHIRHTVVRVKTLSVIDDTKTRESKRDLALFPTAVKCLKGLRLKQIQNKAFYGGNYQNTNDYVFCWEDGHQYDPNYITARFRTAMHDFGRPEITLHKLRHTCASILIARGWDIKKVQYWLGHEDIQTTLNIYAHYIKAKDNQDGNDLEEVSSRVAGFLD